MTAYDEEVALNEYVSEEQSVQGIFLVDDVVDDYYYDHDYYVLWMLLSDELSLHHNRKSSPVKVEEQMFLLSSRLCKFRTS